MANKKLRVHAQVPTKTRDLLLRMVRPSLANVYCQGLTYAYGVTPNVQYPTGYRRVVVTGIHRTFGSEALVCTVDGVTHRPDGKLFHITLSTADGVPPASAGDIDPAAVEAISPIAFELQFQLGHTMVTRAQPLERLAA